MKSIAIFVGVLALTGLSGCATEEYVRSQTDPLAQRISKLEATAADQAAAIKQANDKAQQANDKAQQALDAANKVAGDFKGAQQDVQKAEDAAMRADNSAKEAAKAAESAKQMVKKSEKIFNLEQKK